MCGGWATWCRRNEERSAGPPPASSRPLGGQRGHEVPSVGASMKSLRARLLWFLLAAIVLAAGTQAFVAYRAVLEEADDIFDHHMQQMALSLRAGLPPSSAVGGLGGGEDNFEFIVQIWTLDGIRIFDSAAQSALPQRAVLGFS